MTPTNEPRLMRICQSQATLQADAKAAICSKRWPTNMVETSAIKTKIVTMGGIRAAPLKAIPDSTIESVIAYKLRIAIRGEAQNRVSGHAVSAPLTVAIHNFDPKPRGGVVRGISLKKQDQQGFRGA